MGKADEKQLWKEYMEDYNTGTLKHRSGITDQQGCVARGWLCVRLLAGSCFLVNICHTVLIGP